MLLKLFYEYNGSILYDCVDCSISHRHTVFKQSRELLVQEKVNNMKIDNNLNSKYAVIGSEVESMMSVSDGNLIDLCTEMKAAYPSIVRLVSTKRSVTEAVNAAYKTASGLISKNEEIICESIYSIDKLDLAVALLSEDGSIDTLHCAAYEVARDVFVGADIDAYAEVIAEKTGVNKDVFKDVVKAKLANMRKC